MALNITSFQLLTIGEYTRGMSDPGKITTCTNVYRTVSSIDLVDLINRYNRLEFANTSAELTALNDLKNDINTYYSLVDHEIKSNPPDTTIPAIVMKGYLSTIRSYTESAIKNCSRSVKHPFASKVTSARKKVDKVKKGIQKVEGAYKKFSGPADSIYRQVENNVENGTDWSKFLRRKP